MTQQDAAPEALNAKHRELLERAVAAVDAREYWSQFPEVPSKSIYGADAAAQGERAFNDLLGRPFPIDVPGAASTAATLKNPSRFLGMHFFNPVPASSLVELVIGPQTADEVRDTALGWVRSLGKTAVVVRDSPGFATSRLGVLLGLEAIRMLAEGVADAQAIDTAMELGYRHPMGPLRSTDLVGHSGAPPAIVTVATAP